MEGGGFKGVKLRYGRYRAEITHPITREKVWLGTTDDPVVAAQQYDAAARSFRGKYTASVNFPLPVTNLNPFPVRPPPILIPNPTIINIPPPPPPPPIPPRYLPVKKRPVAPIVRIGAILDRVKSRTLTTHQAVADIRETFTQRLMQRHSL